MIELDGSQGEGGGQILRTALALSLLTGQSFHIHNIRAIRSKPGLLRQHLACVQAAVAICGESASNASGCTALNDQGQPVQLGDMTLRFTPGKVRAGDYSFAINSAGSCMLVLQTVMWPLLLACDLASTLELHGGTHNPMAPSFDFLQAVKSHLLPGAPDALEMELLRHGFYPAGGGQVKLRLIPPEQGLAGMNLMKRGALREAYAVAAHAGVPKGVAERELAEMQKALGWQRDQLRNRPLRANEGPGNALLVHLAHEHITEVFAAYGEKGVSAEDVAKKLLWEVQAYLSSAAPVGEHLADQLMIPMAWAALQGKKGQFWTTALSEHSRTNAQIIEKFLPVRFELVASEDGVKVSAAAV